MQKARLAEWHALDTPLGSSASCLRAEGSCRVPGRLFPWHQGTLAIETWIHRQDQGEASTLKQRVEPRTQWPVVESTRRDRATSRI